MGVRSGMELRLSGLATSTLTLTGLARSLAQENLLYWYFLASGRPQQGEQRRGNTHWSLGTKSGLCCVMTVCTAMGKTLTLKPPASYL